MFTGIIEEIGTIIDVIPIGTGKHLRIYASASSQELKIHDSVSVNGVCLTVVSRDAEEFEVDVVEETIKKTTLGSFAIGDHINIELPLRYHDRLHGHMVLGHVDTVGIITQIERQVSSWLFSIELPPQYMKYIIPVGSIAVDGVSLTIAYEENNIIRISIIPHTWENTIYKFYDIGDKVNLEFDIIGKYVERMLLRNNGKLSFSEQELRELGY